MRRGGRARSSLWGCHGDVIRWAWLPTTSWDSGPRPPSGMKGPVHVVESAPRVRASGRRFSTARAVFWLLFAVNLVNYLDRLLAVAVGPTLQRQFHLLDRDIGRLSSAFLIVYTLATLPLGLLADRAPRARVVSVCLAFWSLLSMATAGVRSFVGLFL